MAKKTKFKRSSDINVKSLTDSDFPFEFKIKYDSLLLRGVEYYEPLYERYVLLGEDQLGIIDKIDEENNSVVLWEFKLEILHSIQLSTDEIGNKHGTGWVKRDVILDKSSISLIDTNLKFLKKYQFNRRLHLLRNKALEPMKYDVIGRLLHFDETIIESIHYYSHYQELTVRRIENNGMYLHNDEIGNIRIFDQNELHKYCPFDFKKKIEDYNKIFVGRVFIRWWTDPYFNVPLFDYKGEYLDVKVINLYDYITSYSTFDGEYILVTKKQIEDWANSMGIIEAIKRCAEEKLSLVANIQKNL